MLNNVLYKFFILSLIINPIFFSCSRDNSQSIINPTEIQKIYPINEYLLDILEPSGIVYNSINNSLMVVSDGRPDIYEVSLFGVTLNTIIASGSDMEGITLSRNCDTIYVVEEKKKLVTSFNLSGSKLASFSADVATNDNSALEGITINKTSNNLFVINEKYPRMILSYNNLTERWRKTIDYASDISDIYYEDSTNCFWLISDESQKILKLSSTGELLKEWQIPFTKGEGITIVGDKIYIVNDSDGKLYVFQKPS